MSLKKTLLIFAILFMIIFNSLIVNAVMAAPSPICEITGVVLDVIETKNNSLDYRISLDIIEISTFKQEGEIYCDNKYIERINDYHGALITLTEYNLNPLIKGQKINAKIHFSGDERSSRFSLTDVNILEQVTSLNNSITKKKSFFSNFWYKIKSFFSKS
jgi:hypothetical protein